MDPVACTFERMAETTRRSHRQRILQEQCNTLQPGQLSRLYQRLAMHPDPAFRAACAEDAPYWKTFLSQRMRRLSARPPRFETQPLHEQVQLYRTEGVPRAQKRLIVVFSGRLGQAFVPFALILDGVPEGDADILLIRNGMHEFFRHGVRGLGGSFAEMAQTLRTAYHVCAYRHVTVLGLSSGGLFALAMADALGADLAISLSGRFPFDLMRLGQMRARGLAMFDPFCACRAGRQGTRIAVFPTKFEPDVMAARRAREIRPGLALIHMPLTQRHNVLLHLWEIGILRPFLRIRKGLGRQSMHGPHLG